MFSVSSLCTQVLINNRIRNVAADVHAECSNSAHEGGCPPSLANMLDEILNPNSKTIDDRETINWCKWLIAGGDSPEDFAKTVTMYDSATTCGLVWTPNFVAYRCRTCGISPCMSLCTECFKKGNHYGHDFNMFLSQAGGACDCGDASVMKESGFCDRHGPKAAVDKSAAPSDLMCVAEAMMPRIILRLIQYLRENCTVGPRNYGTIIQDADEYLTMLIDFNKMGALMRHVMTSALTSPQKYKNLMDPSKPTEQPGYHTYCHDSNEIYQNAVWRLRNPEPPDEYKECASLQEHLQHTTFLEELMFWTVVYQFPQKLVCLLLNMLPDPDYKEALTRAFVLHYSRVSRMLEGSTDPDTLSNKVVHVSVQLFSNQSLALKMVDELKLLHVMVIALKYMMSKILIQNTLHDPDKNFHYVVDCERQVMKEHCYWPIVSDLNNVLSHKPIAVRFMNDNTLLEMWFDFLSMFQGMNVNQRELNQHVQYESNTYYAAFSAELEASAYPMWALVSHLHGPESVHLTRKVLSVCLTALQDWLDAINFTDPNVSDSFQVSFHLPLHRYFAVFLCQAIRQQGATLNDLLPPTDMLHLLMMHPLRVQVAFYEILNGLWIRNGLQIKGQIMTYIQCNFCNSMVDADLYLLQLCATKLQPDVFLKTIIEKFQIKQEMSLRLYRASPNEYMDGEHDTLMLESFLTFLAILVNVRTNLGLSDPEMSRLEMVTLLSMGDKTHSQLMELMPERCGSTQNRDFESVLADVAVYRAPNLEASGNMQQGMYGPKPRLVWEELFDPLHVLLRAAQKGEFQMAMDRFTQYVKQSGRLKSSAIPWPPFRHPAPVASAYDDPRNVLRSRVFHAMILIILYKAVYGHNISEHIMALTIYLLEMAVVTAELPDKSMNPLCQYTSERPARVIKDMDLAGWYITDNLSDNLRMVIPEVLFAQEPESSGSDSEFEWEIQGELTEVGTSLMINDATENSLEVLALPSLETISNDTGLQIAMNASLPALPQPNDQFEITFQVTYLSEANNEDDSITLQRALPSSTEESMALALESPPLPNNIGTQPALPPAPQRPAVMAGNEIVVAPSVYSRLSNSRVTSTEIVPSTSSSHKNFKRRETQNGSQAVKVDESIITLLLKLHSKLSGVPDSYNPEQDGMSDTEASSSSTTEPSESRIGDGPFFVAQLLNKIANLDPTCKEAIKDARNKLWPSMQKSEDKQREKEDREREERRRRAKERQQKLMAEFANKRKQFMEKAMETDEAGVSGMAWEEKDDATKLTSKKEYDCVICSQSSPSTENNPIGLVVLFQETSVIGHERQQPDRVVLPTSDDDPPIPKSDTRGAHFDRRINAMNRHFERIPLLLSVNIGWESGVYVQTCGHHLHLECLLPYVKSLGHQQRDLSLSAENGEYLCPLCRQLANCFLPLSPKLGKRGTIVRSPYAPLSTIIPDINNLLKEILKMKFPRKTFLSEAMRQAVQDMTRCAYVKIRQPNCRFVNITSIARTNFEIELVQRGGSLCIPPPTTIPLRPKRDCTVALLDVLAWNARLSMFWPAQHTWQQLAGLPLEPVVPLALAADAREVPLLLKDPTALLIQFILLLPLHLDHTYFNSVVKVIFNLLYYQVIVQISCGFSEAERNSFLRRECSRDSEHEPVTSETILSRIIEYFNDSPLYHLGHVLYDASTSSCTPYARDKMHSIEQQIQSMCLPFLRVAALLRYHLYEEPLPIIRLSQAEFSRLVCYLELVTDWKTFNSAIALNWQDNETSVAVPRMWCDQFLGFVSQNDAGRCLIMEQHISWQVPKLLGLPREYEKIFTYYHGRQCRQGHSIPQEISICLLCGAIVCLKQTRKQWNVCEVVQHSIDCGGGTGIYLVVTSTYIVVIRGQRVCLWGSLYLDDFEEEDKDLKRGKPLYLNQDRYQLLEQQWLAHRFDHTKKTWVWHRDIL
ncbi:E3 ubiquitin-protein ligase Ubr3 isoform X2 [Ceratina calcarata]|uniref:E3 ubiquitin-protein ligase n=1 Tax=Ceratina calcarata TaxID=156304 RepID=A0AAJ7IZ84_9HYME|nr:E3 ubiquitin-protein ligase Ubr3 isoform X2 [Ceratina calcarata]